MAALNAVLGEQRIVAFTLVDDTPAAAAPAPDDPEPLVTLAFQSRPDLLSLNQQFAATRKFSAAKPDLIEPTV